MKKILTLSAFLLIFSAAIAQHTSVSGDSTYVDFNTLDESLTCDSLSKIAVKFGGVEKITDPHIKMLVALAQMRCAVKTLNDLSQTVDGDTATAYQAQLSFIEEDGKPRALFNLIDTKTLTTAAAYAKSLVEFAPALIGNR